MTDDERSLDERASALLDGDIGDDDERVRARAEEFRQIRDVLGSPPPPEEDLTERAVAAAMAATSTSRPRRSAIWRTRVLAAAATVAVVGGGVFAASQVSMDAGDDRADGSGAVETATDEMADAVEEPAPDVATGDLESVDSSRGGDTNRSTFDTDEFLGEFASFTELDETLTARLDSEVAPVEGAAEAIEEPAAAGSSPSDSGRTPTCAPDGLSRLGTAIVGGTEVVVFTGDADELLVTTEAVCEPVPPDEMTARTSSP